MNSVWAKQNKNGFTIVELLIVIVVIAILAAVTTVSYNAVRQRAENTKTISAANAWLKAMKLYETENNEYPHFGFDACLGEGYPWDYEGTATGNNQCYGPSVDKYYTEVKNINLRNALKPYVSTPLPSPSMTAIGSSANWRRGLSYQTPVVGGTFKLSMALVGDEACPALSGISSYSRIAHVGGGLCMYQLGTRLR